MLKLKDLSFIKSSLLFLKDVFMFMCVNVLCLVPPEGVRSLWNWSCRWLSSVMWWVLRAKRRSSAKVATALKHLATSPASTLDFLKANFRKIVLLHTEKCLFHAYVTTSPFITRKVRNDTSVQSGQGKQIQESGLYIRISRKQIEYSKWTHWHITTLHFLSVNDQEKHLFMFSPSP